MSRALVVFDLRVEPHIVEERLAEFMKALLHTNNFRLPVSDIWRATGMPSIHLIDNGSSAGSKLKRVRILP